VSEFFKDIMEVAVYDLALYEAARSGISTILPRG